MTTNHWCAGRWSLKSPLHSVQHECDNSQWQPTIGVPEGGHLNHRYTQYSTSVITHGDDKSLVCWKMKLKSLLHSVQHECDNSQWRQITGVPEDGHLNHCYTQYITSVLTHILSPQWTQVSGMLADGHIYCCYTEYTTGMLIVILSTQWTHVTGVPAICHYCRCYEYITGVITVISCHTEHIH